MNEMILIRHLKKKKQAALERLIDHYAGYVTTIVRNILSSSMTAEDIEEVVSDVFFSVWNHADQITRGYQPQAYIAAIARNTAKNKLRELRPNDCLLDNDVLLVDNRYDEQLEQSEQKEIIQQALQQMNPEDRMIFLKYYYFYEKISDISQAFSMNESTVKSRLYRGRSFLRQVLTERGYTCED